MFSTNHASLNRLTISQYDSVKRTHFLVSIFCKTMSLPHKRVSAAIHLSVCAREVSVSRMGRK